MHIHILGICGTFMGSIAQLAIAMGHKVTGCDKNVYPPMSDQLRATGIEIIEGFNETQLDTIQPDLFIIGNIVSRGNPLMETILDKKRPYCSGPQWLSQHILSKRWVLAVSGTHGKTSTASMLAWILDYAGMAPGYLIGGVPANFQQSARLGDTDFFVIEADEYDTAFFDKRSKFIHYQPNTLLINNLEFDHADIFPDLKAIQTQFHHLIRTLPRNGLLIANTDKNVTDVIDRGCWSSRHDIALETHQKETAEIEATDSPPKNTQNLWQSISLKPDNSQFDVLFSGEKLCRIDWALIGEHNMQNALGAIAAARHVGVLPEIAAEALAEFQGVKRRLEKIASTATRHIYDDFAHHPTAIASTLKGLRANVGDALIFAVIEPRSNTMKLGIHADALQAATHHADQTFWLQPQGTQWHLDKTPNTQIAHQLEALIQQVITAVEHVNQQTVHIVIMSNGGFGGIHQRLKSHLCDGE